MPGFIFGHHERFAGVRKKDMGDEKVHKSNFSVSLYHLIFFFQYTKFFDKIDHNRFNQIKQTIYH